jgi:hypothetical protein
MRKALMFKPDVACVLVFAALAIAGMLLLPQDVSLNYAAEGHVIETLSLAVLAIALGLSTVQLLRKFSLPWLSANALLLWACLRELDFQKRFTFRSIESIGFYTADHVSAAEKLTVLLALLPFLVAAAHLALFTWTRMQKHVPGGNSWIAHLTAIAVLAMVALGCEKIIGGSGEVVEEISELAMAVLLFLLVLNRMEAGSELGSSSEAEPRTVRSYSSDC